MNQKNIFAYTEVNVTGYPGYVSLNEREDGIVLSVRETGGHDASSCAMSRDELLKLRDALTTYLQA